MNFRDVALRLVTDNGYRDLAELGVWRGDLSQMLATVARRLVLVDPMSATWNRLPEYTCTMGGPEQTQEELNAMFRAVWDALPQAMYLRLSSLEAAALVPDGSLDFVFIDSVHLYRYCLPEIRAWLPKIRPGGMIAGDDYVPEHRAVSRAVDEIFGVKLRDTVWWERV